MDRDEVSSGPEPGRPVGRRIVLGLLGLGALGVATGTTAQNAVTAVLGPVQMHDPTGLLSVLPLGANFRIYSVTGSVRTEDEASYRLRVDGLVDHPATTWGQLVAYLDEPKEG